MDGGEGKLLRKKANPWPIFRKRILSAWKYNRQTVQLKEIMENDAAIATEWI